MVGLAVELEPFDIKALHKLDEGEGSRRRQQPLQLLGADHHHGIPAADGDALRSLTLGPPHHLAEWGLGVLQFPASVSLNGSAARSRPCRILHLVYTRFF